MSQYNGVECFKSIASRRNMAQGNWIYGFELKFFYVLQITFPVFPSSSPVWTVAPQGFSLNSLVIAMPVQCVAQLGQIGNPLKDKTLGSTSSRIP